MYEKKETYLHKYNLTTKPRVLRPINIPTLNEA